MHSRSASFHSRRAQRRKACLVATALIVFVGSVHAQPSTNGPSGTGPSGAPPGIVFGSGTNPPGSSPTAGESPKVASKHVKKTTHRHK
jgi:hypothetical protein